jgi:REP element-mobilizing transposase RayT
MARPIRVEFPGAVYHVMARGNERREVFRDDQDRKRFLETLAETVRQFGLRLHAYCLMPNHYHLVLGTPQEKGSVRLLSHRQRLVMKSGLTPFLGIAIWEGEDWSGNTRPDL